MECEAAFKTSSRMDAGLKFSPRAFLEELSASNVQNLTPSDQFFVDGLLDFSHHDALPEQPDQPQQPLHDSLPVSPRLLNKTPKTSSVTDDFASAQLILPADEEADLEWLSHFVEDSFFEYSAPYPAGTLPGIPKTETEKVLEFETPVAASPCFPTPVPAKARSKRTRTGLRVWSLGFPPITESSSSTSSSSSSSSSPLLIYNNSVSNPQLIGFEAKSPSVNKLKRRTADEAAEGVAASTPRKCSHCGVQKTPQWRTGPLGAKTLCNACGVRYKSGRLLPEYRPACSPTFSSELHSNHHRKVLEMRREKEMSEMGSGLEPPTVVPSF
ncbi:GATA transcription factor 5 isoform X1 [Neltuma alba]|uniref:GATA transcription factor 5 isoform X1 n=1 Tax=Neltuma alba TaxID=207710 RepID=UPI0010A563F0|nr:GATA transcription factor 5-like isoform X1 [Prosopis alba]